MSFTFLQNIPQPADNLDFSQSELLTNNQALDGIFGIDHYKFSNSTANQGFHNKVTTPVFVDSPPTGLPPVTTSNPILYAFQDSVNLGVLQYSRGPNSSAPTPITCFQSPLTPITLVANTPQTVLDFTGLPLCIASFYCVSMNGTAGTIEYVLKWSGTALFSNAVIASGAVLSIQITGNILQILSTLGLTNVYWSLRFHRIN